MKLMIAGLGSIGRRHLRNLLALGERDILLYRTHHSTLPDEELAPFPVETDLDAALAHQPDAVIVSNPTALHLDVAIPAARAGCHLLLEKPISDRMDNRVNTLNEIVAEKELQVLVGYQFPLSSGIDANQSAAANRRVGQTPLRPCALGRVSPGVASLGGLPPGVRSPEKPGRWGGQYPLPPAGLPALVVWGG